MAEEKEILENTFVFSILKYISYILLIFFGLLITKYLGPAAFGLYSAMMLFLKYSTFTFRSFFAACRKKIPYLRGQGQNDKIQEIRNATYTPTFYIMLFISLLVFISTYFLNYETTIILSLRIISILIILQHFSYFYTTYLVADRKFIPYAIYDLLFNMFRLILVLVFIRSLSVANILLILGGSYILSTLISYLYNPYKFQFRFKPKLAKKMFLFGLPTIALGFMGDLFTSIDKLMIINFFDRTQLGLYSFAVLVLEVIKFIPVNITTILSPIMLKKHGEKVDNMKNFLIMPLQIISYMIPIIMGGAFCFSEVVIRHVFPEYLPVLTPLKYVIASAFFLSNLLILENYFVTTNQEMKILLQKVFFIICAFVFNYIVIRLGYGLTGIAVTTVIIYACYFFVLMFMSLKIYLKSRLLLIKEIAIVIFPYIYTFLALGIIGSFNVFTFDNQMVMEFINSGMRYLVFLILNIPLWAYLNRRTGVFNLVYISIQSRFSR